MPRYLSLSLLLLLSASNNLAFANLIADPTRVTVEGIQKSQKIRVFNSGDNPLFLEVSLVKVENPGEAKEIKTPIGEIKHPEMIFNPTRVTLAPNQEREVSIIPLKSPQQETLYRLYLKPVHNLKAASHSTEPAKDISAPMVISVGYGVLIHHVPEKAAQLKGEEPYICVKGNVQLIAKGNIHRKFTDLKDASAPNDRGAKKEIISSKNIYPGVPYLTPVRKLSGKVDGETINYDCE